MAKATKATNATEATEAPKDGKEYPSWRYHKSGKARIVHTPDEDATLGKGWADTPAAHKPAEPVGDDD